MYFFSKCDQIRSFLRIWSHLLKKYIMENFIFCAVYLTQSPHELQNINVTIMSLNENDLLHVIIKYTFFYKQQFYKKRQAEIGKNQAKAKQHPEAELLLIENYSLFSSTLLSKNNRRHSKKCTKKQVRLFE